MKGKFPRCKGASSPGCAVLSRVGPVGWGGKEGQEGWTAHIYAYLAVCGGFSGSLSSKPCTSGTPAFALQAGLPKLGGIPPVSGRA